MSIRKYIRFAAVAIVFIVSAVPVMAQTAPPVLDPIGPQTVAEGSSLNLPITATDADVTIPVLTTSALPANAAFLDNGNGTGSFSFSPDFSQAGEFSVTFYATDAVTTTTDVDSETVVITVTNTPQTPVVSDIPNQTIAEGATFATVNLDDYVTDADNTDAEMTWSYSGNTALTVSIVGRVATITTPTADWNGAETITFRATDPGTLFAEDAATFTVTAANDAPVVSDIPNQTIAEGATFATVNLDDYVTDADNTDAEMTWSYSGNTALTVSIVDRVATITTPTADWNGAETITFRATDPGTLFAEDAATFTVTAANDAPVVSDIPDQTIAEGATFATVNLDDYVTDADNTDAEMTWSYSGNTALTVSIVDRVATITTPTADWNGAETITFRATDPGTLFAEDAATFTVTAANDAPVVSDIPDQTIAEGATFATVNLDDYVTDADNTDGEMTWSYSGNTALTVSIVDRVATITTPTADWNGAETITFRATDPGTLFAEDAATFTVTAANDAPVVSDIPDQTIAEGATFTTINLDDYVTDADNTDAEMTWTYSGNTALTVSIVGRVATITMPTADWNGAETITFRATDPGTLFAEDAATFTVTVVNDAPVLAAIGPRSVAEGANLNFIASATDVDGTTPTLSVVDVPANATFIDNGNGTGTFDFSPDFTQGGVYNVTFIASDGVLADTEIVAVTVTDAGNQAPVVSDIPNQTIAEGATFATVNLDDYVTDADNTDAEMTWSYSGNTALTVSIVGRVATITTPTADWNGAETITFRATDPGLAFGEDAAVFTVTNINDAPVVSDIPDQTIAEGSTFATVNLDDYVTDADNTDGEMTWSYSGNTALTVSIVGRVATITAPTADWNGAETITFRATDPGTLFAEDAATFTVTAANDAPVLAAIGPRSVAEGANLNFNATANDVDGTTPTLSAVDVPTNATFVNNGDGTGTFNFNPDYTQGGLYNVTFIATDGVLADTEIVAITVTDGGNQAPVVSDIPDQTIAEGATFATVNLDDYVTDADNTDGEMTWSYSGNTALTVSIVGRVATITTPTADWNGAETITFRATDPGLAFGEDAAVFTVTNINDAPVVSDIPDQTIAEGATFATVNLDDYVTDADNTDAEMTWSYSGNTALTVSIVDRVATITMPTADWNGAETITFRATDPGTLFAEDAATFTVTAVNDAPVMTAIGPRTVAEGATLNFGVTTADIDGPAPTVLTAENVPANGTFADNGDGTGTFTFTPDFTQLGVYNVTFIASDGLLADTEIVAITVNETNRPPELAAIGPQTVVEGQSLVFAVSATDLDGNFPALTISPLTNASLVDAGNGTGTFTFNPDFTQAGVQSVTFYASDGFAIDSEIVAITVSDAGNQPPVLNPIGNQTIYENAVLNLTITATDGDGTIPTLSALSLPANATFTDNLDGSGSLAFTPNFTQAGVYSVTFKAFDGILVDSEVIAITVLNTNREPILAAIGQQTVTEGQNLHFTVTAADPDATVPAITTSTLPTNATFADNHNGTGTFDFTPSFNQSGIYTVTFYAGDGAATDSEIVSIIVSESGNQAPKIDSIGPRFVTEGAILDFTMQATDPDGTTPVLSVLNLPENATFVDNLNGTGTFHFTPDFTQAGVYGVSFIASDGVLADTELVLVTVRKMGNVAPVLAPVGPQTVSENDTLTINLTATDPNIDSMFFSYTTKHPMIGLQLVDNHDGTALLTYMPDNYSSGVDTIKIFVTDYGTPRLSDYEEVVIMTVEMNQPPVIAALGPFTAKVGKQLRFAVHAYDSTAAPGDSLFLTASGIPQNATFVDSGNGTGAFFFTPASNQVGVLTVRFIAVDDGIPAMTAYRDVQITVVATNRPPVLAMIGPKLVTEGQTLTFGVSATDPDGTIPALTADDVPTNATFVDNGDGTGTFSFVPSFIQSGLYGMTIRASDGIDSDKEVVLIQVVEAGNQRPIVATIGPKEATEAVQLQFRISATDPDGSTPAFTAAAMPNGAVLVDSANGAASFTWTPLYNQAGVYDVDIIAGDGVLADTEVVTITVLDGGNQKPVLNAVADVSTTENKKIKFTVTAGDPDSVAPILSTSALPGTATFNINDDDKYTGTFEWLTGIFDAGTHAITFYATDSTDAALIDSVQMQITVADSNRIPWCDPESYGQRDSLNEGDTLYYYIVGNDSDLTIPILSTYETIPNFVFTDSANGRGVLRITPDHTQGGQVSRLYDIHFVARDSDPRYTDDTNHTEAIQFRVWNVTVPPVLTPIGPQTITEGDTLSFLVSATNPNSLTDPASVFVDVNTMPANATFTGVLSPKSFRFFPNYLQAGEYTVMFGATAGTLNDTEYVTITVLEAGNQPPYFVQNFADTQKVVIGNTIANRIVAIDPELDPVTLAILSPPANAVFVDSTLGIGSMIFTPTSDQVGATYVLRYVATDNSGAADTLNNWIRVMAFMRGDANGDLRINIADVTYIVDYIFRDGPEPVLPNAADANFDTAVSVADALYLVNYIFRHGPPPPVK